MMTNRRSKRIALFGGEDWEREIKDRATRRPVGRRQRRGSGLRSICCGKLTPAPALPGSGYRHTVRRSHMFSRAIDYVPVCHNNMKKCCLPSIVDALQSGILSEDLCWSGKYPLQFREEYCDSPFGGSKSFYVELHRLQNHFRHPEASQSSQPFLPRISDLY